MHVTNAITGKSCFVHSSNDVSDNHRLQLQQTTEETLELRMVNWSVDEVAKQTSGVT